MENDDEDKDLLDNLYEVRDSIGDLYNKINNNDHVNSAKNYFKDNIKDLLAEIKKLETKQEADIDKILKDERKSTDKNDVLPACYNLISYFYKRK